MKRYLLMVCVCSIACAPAIAQDAVHDVTPNVIEAADTFVSPDGLTQVELFVNATSVPDTPAALSVLTIGPGAGVPEHLHEGVVEMLYIVAGSGTMTVAGVAQPVVAGSAVYIPAATRPSYANGAIETLALQVYAGPGPEARFRAWNAADATETNSAD